VIPSLFSDLSLSRMSLLCAVICVPFCISFCIKLL
jgi:hypothetical protein